MLTYPEQQSQITLVDRKILMARSSIPSSVERISFVLSPKLGGTRLFAIGVLEK